MEEQFTATMQPIVPAVGRGHVWPVIPPLVNRLGLSLPPESPILPLGSGRVPGMNLSDTCTCARQGHVRSSEPPKAGQPEQVECIHTYSTAQLHGS